MAFSARLKGRYETKDIIAEGGMGVVYRAIDHEMQSEVALKTIQELHDPQQLEMFRKECAVLRKLRHPNVVDLYDYGVIEDEGQKKPFFVMPLLPGVTLDKLIRNQAARLTPERVVDIITQTCKGLQAAHELGLVHRDIKPSNIFVLDDDSVKLIDFGVVHLIDQRSVSGLKGTLLYMSPEQIEMNPPTGASDIFSLAVVCYEALTRRRPFTGSTDAEVREAILRLIPPPISELNPAVSLALSQVVHAAMAKHTWHRTSSARQFAEELQKALHNQPIERFDPVRIDPRISRAQKALENSEYDFAAEILADLEAEGHIHPAIRSLRQQIDQAIRIRTITRSLESARHRFAEEEYQLALQKVEEVLRIEPANAEALALKANIDTKYKTQQIENWFRLAQDHVKNFAFNHARQALQNVLRLKPIDTSAIQMLSEVDRRESEYLRARLEKEELYKVALEVWHRGEVSAALSKLERVLELDRRAPEMSSSESGLLYQNLYNQVRTEHDAIKNAYAEANKLLGENDFNGASAVCEQYLNKYPGHALFQALKFDISERQRQHVSAYIAKIDRDVEAEADLDRKVGILSEALRLYPEETHFKERLERITQRRDLVASITLKVRNLEERGQYAEAVAQLEILRAIYPQYPGMDLEVDRISKRRDQQARAESRLRWVDQIDRALSAGDFSHALNLLKSALADFPDDAELAAQERLARDGMERALQATNLFEQAQRLCVQGDVEAGLDGLWQAHRLDEHNALIRAVLVEMLLKRASAELDSENWTVSQQLVRQAIDLDPGSTQAKSLQRMALDRQKDRGVDLILSNSRELQAAGDLNASLSTLEKGLTVHPDEPRLVARREALLKLLSGVNRQEEREKDLSAMRELKEGMSLAQDLTNQNSLVEQTRVIARKHPGDGEVESVLREIEQLRSATEIFDAATIRRRPEARKRRQAQPSEPLDRPIRFEAPPQPESSVEEQSTRPQRVAVLAGICAVLLIAIAGAWLIWGRPHSSITITEVFEAQISIQASVPGARVFVNGEDRGIAPQTIKFREGEFSIAATLPGYVLRQPAVLRVSPRETVPSTLTLPLDPLPPIFRLFTDFPQAILDAEKITLDGFRFETDRLAPGPHTLNLSSPVSGTITLQFELTPGQSPVVHAVQGQKVGAVVVSSFASLGRIYSTALPLKVTVNEQAVQQITEQGVQLSGLQPGQNQLVFEDASSARTETVPLDANPGITVLVANVNAGNIRVSANVPEASIMVEPTDKKSPPLSAQLKRGGVTVTGLEPKAYRVQIQAIGYPYAEMSVNVQKGQVATAKFTLVKLPTTATLEIRGGTPDADVLLDSFPIGRLSAGGDFTSTAIQPGRHVLVLQKKDNEERRMEREFRAGESVRLADEVRLTPFGRLEFTVNPPNAQITYQSTGEPPRIARNGEVVAVKAGRYSVTARAEKYSPHPSEVHEVDPGRGEAVNLKLNPVVVVDKPKPGPRGPNELDGQLKRDRPDGFLEVLSDLSLFKWNLSGKFTFTIKRKGTFNNRARWYVDYIDSNNYIEYEIDETNVSYRLMSQGKETKNSVSHTLNKSTAAYDVVVDVGERSLAIWIAGAPRKVVPPSIPWNSFLTGRFGFPKGELVRGFQFEESGK